MADRRDYLGECNDQKVSLEDFKLTFCNRCQQPECSRSQHGTSKFDQRVATWVERLVTKVPQMDSADPRLLEIQGKQFKMFTPSLSVGQASAWLDPRDVVEPTLAVEPVITIKATEEEGPVPPLPAIFARAPEPELAEVPEPPPQPEVQTQAEKKEPQGASIALLLMNTPTKSGRMLAGSATLPPKDPWAAPPESPKPPEGEIVVKKGATVRFGEGSGVK